MALVAQNMQSLAVPAITSAVCCLDLGTRARARNDARYQAASVQDVQVVRSPIGQLTSGHGVGWHQQAVVACCAFVGGSTAEDGCMQPQALAAAHSRDLHAVQQPPNWLQDLAQVDPMHPIMMPLHPDPLSSTQPAQPCGIQHPVENLEPHWQDIAAATANVPMLEQAPQGSLPADPSQDRHDQAQQPPCNSTTDWLAFAEASPDCLEEQTAQLTSPQACALLQQLAHHVKTSGIATSPADRSSQQGLGHARLCTAFAKRVLSRQMSSSPSDAVPPRQLASISWACGVMSTHLSAQAASGQFNRRTRRRTWHQHISSPGSHEVLQAALQSMQSCVTWVGTCMEVHWAATPSLSTQSSPLDASQHEQRPCCDATSLALVLWGLAQVQVLPPDRWLSQYFSCLTSVLQSRGPDGSTQPPTSYQELSCVLYSLGRLQARPPPQVMEVLMAAADEQLGSASQQSLANTVWALARLNMHPTKQFFTRWCTQFALSLSGAASTCRPGQYTPQQQQHHVSQSLWAIATMQLRPCHVWLSSLLNASLPSLPSASAQSLTNTMWALGKVCHCPAAPWTRAFLAASQALLTHVTPQGMCNLLHGLLLAQVPVPKQWGEQAVAAAAQLVRGKQLSAAQLSMLMWTISELHLPVSSKLLQSALGASSTYMGLYGGHLHHTSRAASSSSHLLNSYTSTRASAASAPVGSVTRPADRSSVFLLQPHHLNVPLEHRQLPARLARHSSRSRSPSPVMTPQPGLHRPASSPSPAPPGLYTPRPSVAAHAIMEDPGVQFREAGAASGLVAMTRPAASILRSRNSPGVHSIRFERFSLPARLQMDLLKLRGKRQQKQRRARCAARKSKLHHLSPLGLARLLHALAQALPTSKVSPPNARWRVACTMALRAALPSMSAACLSIALPAAIELGVRPPLLPTKHALHRVVRDAQPWDTNALAVLAAGMAGSKRASDKWLANCLSRFSAGVPDLSLNATVGLAKALPALQARVIKQLAHAEGSGSFPGPGTLPVVLPELATRLSSRVIAWLPSMDKETAQAVLQGIACVTAAPVEQPSTVSSTSFIRPRPQQRHHHHRHHLYQQPSRSNAPWSHLMITLEAKLATLPALSVAHVLSSIPDCCQDKPSARFLAVAESASLRALSQLCLSSTDKADMLHGLHLMGWQPSESWASIWYSATQSRLTKLGPKHLSLVLKYAEDWSGVSPQIAPPASWLSAAFTAAAQVVNGANWALRKQLGTPLASTVQLASDAGAIPAGEARSEDGEVDPGTSLLVGTTLGSLLAVVSRLHVLHQPVEASKQLQAELQVYVTGVMAGVAQGGLLPCTILHAILQLRGIHPALAPSCTREAMAQLLGSLTLCDPGELLTQLWDHSVSTTTVLPTPPPPTLLVDGVPYTPPAPASMAAANKVLETLAAFVRWQVSPPAQWLDSLLVQVASRIGCFTGPQAAALLRTLALLPAPTPPATATVQLLLEGCLPAVRSQCTHAQVAEVGWALSMLQAAPTPSWWAAYESELLTRMSEMRSEELCEIMWAFGSLRRCPSHAWMEGFARALVPQMASCNGEQLARLVWALAAVEVVPAALVMDRYMSVAAQALQLPGGFTAQTLSLMIGGLATLGLRPRKDWLDLFAMRLADVLPECRGVHLLKILTSLAALGHQPGAQLVSRTVDVVVQLLPELDAGGVAQITWAVGRLDTSHGKQHLARLEAAADSFCILPRQQKLGSSSQARRRPAGKLPVPGSSRTRSVQAVKLQMAQEAGDAGAVEGSGAEGPAANVSAAEECSSAEAQPRRRLALRAGSRRLSRTSKAAPAEQ